MAQWRVRLDATTAEDQNRKYFAQQQIQNQKVYNQ